MKTIIRMLPALVAAFVLGVMFESPGYWTHTASSAREGQVGAVLGACVLVTLFLVYVTRSRQRQENTSTFGYTPRSRSGRN